MVLTTFLSLVINIDSMAQQLNPGDGIRVSFLDITDLISGDYFVQPTGDMILYIRIPK